MNPTEAKLTLEIIDMYLDNLVAYIFNDPTVIEGKVDCTIEKEMNQGIGREEVYFEQKEIYFFAIKRKITSSDNVRDIATTFKQNKEIFNGKVMANNIKLNMEIQNDGDTTSKEIDLNLKEVTIVENVNPHDLGDVNKNYIIEKIHDKLDEINTLIATRKENEKESARIDYLESFVKDLKTTSPKETFKGNQNGN